ncbi:LuxR C-terminal-related transcriptional regulator [Streptomyces tubbatahanensis]|uniref:LuxR C-terminal-related transcriptional regulator n=1 Tax=Streptomyces tubbatahanensis TaxID=2923272 RepID=A0ABY3XMV7_9ACTN|nr:LuxR C-terminal-related transcriptional regulator [Streptomyces tubbatahanensis]UNS95729.1 LuxR C-terminal-related transcriptional regulator [Streptomyces tubbatahanensis]
MLNRDEARHGGNYHEGSEPGPAGPPGPDAFAAPAAPVTTRHAGRYTRTPVIGRDEELAGLEARVLSDSTRVLTLTGPTGVGKSLMAAALFDAVVGQFADGGCRVELEELGLPAGSTGLADALAAALRLGPWPITALRDREFLLVLDCGGGPPPDGCGPLVTELVDSAARLRVVTAATRLLGVYGERCVQLAPLAVPSAADTAELDRLARVPSVELLVHRTRAARPGFQLTADNRTAVAEMCVRLDGLPLALELAASRLKVASPAALLDELERSPGALQGSSADTLSRHLSMRSAVEEGWSTLGAERLGLLLRLAVFAADFDSLEVSGVLDISAQDAQDALEELLAHSLLLSREQPDGSVRFRMLRHARSHAWGRLEHDRVLAAIREAHAAYFARRALANLALLDGPQQALATQRLDRWRADILVALAELTVRDGERAARLATAALPYWLMRGEARQAVHRLEQVRSAGPPRTPDVHNALQAALGTAQLHAGDLEEGRGRLEHALRAYDLADDRARAARAREQLAWLAHTSGRLHKAGELLEEALESYRDLGMGVGRASALGRLAEVCRDRGEAGEAVRLAEESVRLHEKEGEARGAALARLTWAGLVVEDGAVERAEELARRALLVLRQLRDEPALGSALRVMTAALVGREGRARDAWERAARLLAAADAVEERAGSVPLHHPVAAGRELRALARERLGDAAFETQRRRGAALSAHEAAGQALEPPQPLACPLNAAALETLTRREREVAALVAEGLTNRKVAIRLGIAEWTAVNTLRKVMRKLGCTSRIQVANKVLRTDSAPVGGASRDAPSRLAVSP